VTAKFEFIDAQKADYPILRACGWLGVSRSGFYDWRDRPTSATAARRDRLRVLIQTAFAASDGTYGYRRVHAQLARWGEQASLELVRVLSCTPPPGSPAPQGGSTCTCKPAGPGPSPWPAPSPSCAASRSPRPPDPPGAEPPRRTR
jgi:hypothetical protein